MGLTLAEPEKSPEEKAADEAERRKQREAELDSLLVEMEADVTRCDVANMVYSRAFLHLSRDIEKVWFYCYVVYCPFNAFLESLFLIVISLFRSSSAPRAAKLTPN